MLHVFAPITSESLRYVHVEFIHIKRPSDEVKILRSDSVIRWEDIVGKFRLSDFRPLGRLNQIVDSQLSLVHFVWIKSKRQRKTALGVYIEKQHLSFGNVV